MVRELHISRRARERYRFDDSLFSLAGRVVIPNFRAARLLAQAMNEKRDLVAHPELAARASDLAAMGLIEEVFHYMLQLYREQKNPRVFAEAVGYLEQRQPGTDAVYHGYLEEFPPIEVYRGRAEKAGYLESETGGEPHRAILLEELLMLWLDNVNPAFRRYAELFDDEALEKRTAYRRLVHDLRGFFDTQAPFGPDNENLIDLLLYPLRASPDSLAGQLEAIRRRWGPMLGRYLLRLLSSLDFLREEERRIFGGPGPSVVAEYLGLEGEAESFSPDRDWMPRLVMIAKSTLVWLDQLSRAYGRPIRRLDEIPDEELDRLARWGFTGLWLIGIWERSNASRRIKQLTGNPEAAPSAYSLFDYTISGELGGEEAYRSLRERCRRRGIRLACDMVPNHTGIDSRWVREHPDWYIQLPYSPFPSYTFGGPNLSEDPVLGIYLEDHYYNRTDAAVVFRRTDFRSGETRFIYHGNDGTHMPWNDTAQLDYLNPAVREAAIRTILHVASLFPVIRFDAAMTLTRRHYQRLWFPEPGTGGDIPTRTEQGLSREEFRRRMPQEFWREVVDRVAREAPDTLLLAEAFWLMEGYFVRTLGMHRVYNSAFMNMLKREENAKYRQLIKNTLEFDPEILRRYANFMNNPDEETAVAQFGKGDKYIGVCTLMVTLPGLPMFGHGQIEGFTEKYGMEYTRAYWSEEPDRALVDRHEREIFPLMRRRWLFAGVEGFRLYDFWGRGGGVIEDVIAFSNRAGGEGGSAERALVLVNNRYESSSGWVRTSAAFRDRSAGPAGSGERVLKQEDLAAGLALSRDAGLYTTFRDAVTGLEYIRANRILAEEGLYVELAGYGRHVFLDFEETADDAEGHWRQLLESLGGRGVPSLREALQRLLLKPLHEALGQVLDPLLVERLPAWAAARRVDTRRAAARREAEPLPSAGPRDGGLTRDVLDRARPFLQAAGRQAGGRLDEEAALQAIRRGLDGLLRLTERAFPRPPAGRAGARLRGGKAQPRARRREAGGPLAPSLPDAAGALAFLGRRPGGAPWEAGPVVLGLLYGLVLLRPLGGLLDELPAGAALKPFLQRFGLDEGEAEEASLLVKVLIRHQDWFDAGPPRLQRLAGDPETQRFLKVNRHQGVVWFRSESFDSLLAWLEILTQLDLAAAGAAAGHPAFEGAAERLDLLARWKAAAARSEYRLERLLEGAEG